MKIFLITWLAMVTIRVQCPDGQNGCLAMHQNSIMRHFVRVVIGDNDRAEKLCEGKEYCDIEEISEDRLNEMIPNTELSGVRGTYYLNMERLRNRTTEYNSLFPR